MIQQVDQKKIHEILLSEDEEKYDTLCIFVQNELNISHISLERIYLSQGKFHSLGSCGSPKGSNEVENFTVSALGHPNLGRITVGAKHFDAELRREVDFICSIVSKQFQIDWLKNLMQILSTPIRWHDDASLYLSELATICRRAAAAAHIAIREDSGNQLKATAWNSNERNIDFSGISDIPAKSRAGKIICPPKESDRIYFHGPKSELVDFMRRQLAYTPISVIVSMPIIVQGTRIGAINFAYDHEFDFSPTVKGGLELLSNVIGTALNNYRLRTTIEANARKIFWSGRQALNYELMQGYRHWAGSSLFELNECIGNLVHLVEESDKSEEFTEEDKSEIKDTRTDLNVALSSMEDLTSSYKLDKTNTSLYESFESAIYLLNREIEKEGIIVKNSSLRDSMLGNKDALRALFLNLVLNSIQAFRELKKANGGRKKGDWNIELTLDTDTDKVRFIYKDNGPGLKLDQTLKKASDVWLPEMSTKPNGTGFGMPMIRQVVQKMHGGEIYLNSGTNQRGFSVAGHVLRDGFDNDEWGKQ